MIKDGKYIGDELFLFEKAIHWKNYFSSFIKPHLCGRILEVGAGIGGTTLALCDGTQKEWVCLEPDVDLSATLQKRLSHSPIAKICKIKSCYLANLSPHELFDAILYIDVIEHIKDDKAELDLAATYLKPGGNLIVLVPAHQFLYSPFDKQIGHYRRYSRRQLMKVMPSSLIKKSTKYLDSLGLFASLGNKMFFKSSMPTSKQISLWDNLMVPLSYWTDKFTFYNFGKSVLCIFTKPEF